MKTVTDINKRWENGTPHNPKSIELYKALAELDYALAGDYFCLKSGGDGDNGEHLMYLLDIYFDAKDSGEELELRAFLTEKVSAHVNLP